MPKSKSGTAYKKLYTEDDVQKALQAVADGMSKKKASKLFGVPRPTLIFRLSHNLSKLTPGPSTVLTITEETTLVEWILHNHRKGFPRRKEDIQASVKGFLDKNPRPNPFKNNTPGNGWFKAFLKRHNILTQRTAEAVTSASSNISESDIKNWFLNIETVLEEEGHSTILMDSSRVFNGDETNFQLCPKGNKVIAPRGARNVYEVDRGQAKTSLTVMFTFCANGDLTPPMIIYPNKRRSAEIASGIPDNWGYGLSDNGWMKAETFFEYIGNVLYPHLKNKGTVFPIILFVDGHATHLTYQISQLCSELQIILVCLYPNSTRLLQPADVAAFKPIKNAWLKGVVEWRRNNPTEALTKEKFAPILKTVLERCISKNTIINGFRATGLYPWNKEAIDYSKCLGKSKQHDTEKSVEGRINTHQQNLDFSQFQKIVGKEIMSQFKDPLRTDGNEYFIKLKQIWEYFLPENDDDSFTKDVILDADVDSIREEDVQVFDINDIPIILDYQMVDLDINEIGQIGSKEMNNEIEQKNTNTEKIITKGIHNDVRTEKVTDCPDTENRDQEIIFQDGIEVVTGCAAEERDITLKDVLVWPDSPQRKGKNITERMPYVVTSSKWKDLKNEKITKQRQKEEAVAEKKRKRLELVKAKAETKKLNTNKRQRKCTNESNKIKIISDVTITSPQTFTDIPVKSVNNLNKIETNMDKSGMENQNKHAKVYSEKILVNKIFNEQNIIREQFRGNQKMFKGLCFICVKRVSELLPGIRCLTCSRQYHENCLIKKLQNVDEFVCGICNKNKSKK